MLRQHRRGSADPGDSAEMCQARTRFLSGNWYAPLRDAVAEQARALAPRDVLDAGCGEGYYSAFLAGAGYRVFGIDLSKKGIAAAAKNASRAGL